MPFTIDSYALTTLADVKEHLNIPTATTTNDNILIRQINAASEMIETYIDRKVRQRSFTEYYDGRGNDRILLRQWPVTKPTELWDDSSGLFTDSSNQFQATEFEVEGDPATGVILLGGRKFSKGTRNIKVVYQGGYATTPYIIAECCIWTVEFLYDMKSDRSIRVQSKGKNQETTTFLGDLPPVVKNMLEPYRRFEVPLAYVGVQNT
jgi:hypothetical protein